MELRDIGRYCLALIGLVLCDTAIAALTDRDGIGMDACVSLAAFLTIIQAVREVRP